MDVTQPTPAWRHLDIRADSLNTFDECCQTELDSHRLHLVSIATATDVTSLVTRPLFCCDICIVTMWLFLVVLAVTHLFCDLCILFQNPKAAYCR